MNNQPFAKIGTNNDPPAISQLDIEKQIKDIDKRIADKAKQMRVAKVKHEDNVKQTREYREILMKLQKETVTSNYARLAEEEAQLMGQRSKLVMLLGNRPIPKALAEAAGLEDEEEDLEADKT